MRKLRTVLLALAALCVLPARAWGDHSFCTYRALERMAVVSEAAAVPAEPLEHFLRAEERTLEALLASQEAWAAANLAHYPPLPAALAFTAQPARSDEARRQAFVGALRIAGNTRFALSYTPDPWGSAPGAAVVGLRTGDAVTPLQVVASAADEPEQGMDAFLWDDSPSDWGRSYGFGPTPLGDPQRAATSQQPFHMAFLHEDSATYWAFPASRHTFAAMRHYQFASLSALAFRTGHPYWGWRFAGMALHYLQDLVQPLRASALPGVGVLRLVQAGAFAALGLGTTSRELQNEALQRLETLEAYQSEVLAALAQTKADAPPMRALRNSEKDMSYPEWSDRYLRDVVAPQAILAGPRLLAAANAVLPVAGASTASPESAAGARNGISVMAEAAAHNPDDRARLDNVLTELMGNLGAHTRNAIKGILRAGHPM